MWKFHGLLFATIPLTTRIFPFSLTLLHFEYNGMKILFQYSMLWMGLTVEVTRVKSMQILLQKYFHLVVAALSHRATRNSNENKEIISLFFS